MDAITAHNLSTTIGQRLADVFTRVLAEELAKFDTPAATAGIPVEVYREHMQRLQTIVDDAGCGQMDVPRFDADDLAREAYRNLDIEDEIRSAIESAIENDGPDFSEFESQAEAVQEGVQAARALLTEMQEAVDEAEEQAARERAVQSAREQGAAYPVA